MPSDAELLFGLDGPANQADRIFELGAMIAGMTPAQGRCDSDQFDEGLSFCALGVGVG